MSGSKDEEWKVADLTIRESISATIVDFLKRGIDVGAFDAVLVPMKVPAGNGFAYVLIKDKALLDGACPLPPILAVQGGKAVSNLTRHGRGDLRIGAVMRPCEMRATIELVKLGQVDLGNLTLISMDCPGALPLAGFAEDPEKGISTFEKATRNWEDVDMRPICRICHRGSAISGDLHIGLLSGSRSSLHLISNSNNGKEIIEKLGLTPTEDIDVWKSEVQRISQRRLARREKWHAEFENRVGGVDNLLINLASCINCHNCMRVCPVCYCRLCYFDSERTRHPADDYLDQAVSKGCLRFPPDMLLFHIGRMAHMSLTCVSCGSCEDACPASIPIAQIFSFVADMTQHTFDYVAGRSIDDPLPLSVYREDEFQEGDERDG